MAVAKKSVKSAEAAIIPVTSVPKTSFLEGTVVALHVNDGVEMRVIHGGFAILVTKFVIFPGTCGARIMTPFIIPTKYSVELAAMLVWLGRGTGPKLVVATATNLQFDGKPSTTFPFTCYNGPRPYSSGHLSVVIFDSVQIKAYYESEKIVLPPVRAMTRRGHNGHTLDTTALEQGWVDYPY